MRLPQLLESSGGGGVTLPFTEAFNASTSLPTDWTQQNSSGVTNRWSVAVSTNAGGTTNEMKCGWQEINPGTARLVTPLLNTDGCTSLNLSFKHMLDGYATGATLLVQSSSNGTNWTNESWSVEVTSANIGPVTVNTTITGNVGSGTYVAFVITGDLYQFDNWYVDDVSITSAGGSEPTEQTLLTTNFPSTTLPAGWGIVDNQGNGQVWKIGTHTNGLSGTGSYAYLNSDAYGSGNTQNTDLVTPEINCSSASSVTLSFTHYFRSYTGSSIKLYYSINGGSTWTQIQAWTASTANPTTFSQVITAVAGQSSVKFKWNYTATWGYYWDVDNISVTGMVSAGATAPGAPSKVVMSVLDSKRAGMDLVIDWDVADNATSYYVYSSNDPYGEF